MIEEDILKIDLTPEEQARLANIELEALNVDNGQATWDNCERAAQLTEILLQRNAIPTIRKDVFAKDEYATGRGPSVSEQYRRNGNSYAQTLRHPQFLAWLRYFIYGPNLPADMIRRFQEKVKELGPLTSGDSEMLRHFIRQLTRQFGLKKSDANEVFKLVLEFNDDIYLAKSLRGETLKAAKPY